ncbi:MAG: hypothetical protein ABJA81_01630 [Nocardioidaceae bacterium]
MADASKSSGSEPSSTETASTDETSPTTTDGEPIATTTPGRPSSDAATSEVETSDASRAKGSEKPPDRQAKSVEEKRSERRKRLSDGGKKVKAGSDLIRNRIASVVWLIAVLAAIVLAVGALLYALDANMDNGLVKGVLDVANKIDGPFWRIFEFYQDQKGPGNGPHDATKEHLVNWGLAAVAYLVVGRIVDRVIRP